MNTLAACKDKLLTKRNTAITHADLRTNELRQKVSGLAKIDEMISEIPLRLLELAKGDGYEQNAKKLKEELDSLRLQRKQLIEQAGYPSDYDMPRFSCEKCLDRGFIGYNMCDCLRRMISEENYNRSGIGGLLSDCTFDNFHTYYYPSDPAGADKSPRDVMETVKSRAEKFAASFAGRGESLLFMGGTGLGKTHLSAAIGSVVIKKGYTVVYESAKAILDEFRANAFSDGEYDTDRFFRADLLIIDDLGAEQKGDFSASVFTEIVDKRLIAGKSTVISTNLSAANMVNSYSSRFVSRVLSCYTLLTFVGKDIRLMKMSGEQ